MVSQLAFNLVGCDLKSYLRVSTACFVKKVSSKLSHGESANVVSVCSVLRYGVRNHRAKISTIGAAIEPDYDRSIDICYGCNKCVVPGRQVQEEVVRSCS